MLWFDIVEGRKMILSSMFRSLNAQRVCVLEVQTWHVEYKALSGVCVWL